MHLQRIYPDPRRDQHPKDEHYRHHQNLKSCEMRIYNFLYFPASLHHAMAWAEAEYNQKRRHLCIKDQYRHPDQNHSGKSHSNQNHHYWLHRSVLHRNYPFRHSNINRFLPIPG